MAGGVDAGAAGSWGQAGEGTRQLGGSKGCTQARCQQQRALPKALAARASMQGEHPPPGAQVSAPALVQPNLPSACALTAVPGCTGPVLPAGTLISIPPCDSSPVMSQALGVHRSPAHTTTGQLLPTPLPEMQSWALRNKSCVDMAPQRDLSQTMGLISRITL